MDSPTNTSYGAGRYMGQGLQPWSYNVPQPQPMQDMGYTGGGGLLSATQQAPAPELMGTINRSANPLLTMIALGQHGVPGYAGLSVPDLIRRKMLMRTGGDQMGQSVGSPSGGGMGGTVGV